MFRYVTSNKGLDAVRSNAVVMGKIPEYDIFIQCPYIFDFPADFSPDLLNHEKNWFRFISMVLLLSNNELSGLILGFCVQ